MFVISVCNPKGGAGKSTVAIHLARGLQLRGYQVTLIDADPQQSVLDWSVGSDKNTISIIRGDRPTLDKDVPKIKGADFVIIDSAGRASEMMISAIKAADFVLVPMQPSGADLRATVELLHYLQGQVSKSDGMVKAGVVLNRVVQFTRMVPKVLYALKMLGFKVMNQSLVNRVAYAETVSDGLTVFDGNNDQASAEFNKLIDEILEYNQIKELSHA